MRCAAALLFVLAAGLPASAQVPERISFQGRLTTSAGAPMNGSVSLTFRLYTTSTGGAAIWTEAQSIPVTNGIYVAHLGAVTTLAPIAFDATYWLSVEVATDGEMAPRYLLSSSPYALRARVLQDLTVPVSQLNQLLGISANVTSANLNTLTAGPASNADALHTHSGFSPTSHVHAAADITTGTLSDALLSANVVLLSGSQTFTGTKTFSAAPAFTAAGAPFTVTGTTMVTNLNADLLDGVSAASFATTSHTHDPSDLTAAVPVTLGGTGATDAATGLANLGGASLSSANTFTAGPQTIQTGGGGNRGIVIQAGPCQTARLQEWKNEAGTTVSQVSNSGVLRCPTNHVNGVAGSMITDSVPGWEVALSSNITTAGGLSTLVVMGTVEIDIGAGRNGTVRLSVDGFLVGTRMVMNPPAGAGSMRAPATIHFIVTGVTPGVHAAVLEVDTGGAYPATIGSPVISMFEFPN